MSSTHHILDRGRHTSEKRLLDQARNVGSSGRTEFSVDDLRAVVEAQEVASAAIASKGDRILQVHREDLGGNERARVRRLASEPII